MALVAERAFPSGVTGPRERAPFAREASMRRKDDIVKMTVAYEVKGE